MKGTDPYHPGSGATVHIYPNALKCESQRYVYNYTGYVCTRTSSLEGVTEFKFVSSSHVFTFEWVTSIDTHNSSLEGAMKLKFAPFCSSSDALSNEIIFCESQNFQFQAKNHGL